MRPIDGSLRVPVLDGIDVDRIDVGLDEASPTYALLKTVFPFVLSKLFTRMLKGGIEKQWRRCAMGIRVAAMKRSEIEDGHRHSNNYPEYATLLPGYGRFVISFNANF